MAAAQEGVVIPAAVPEESSAGTEAAESAAVTDVDALAKDMFGKIALFIESELKGEMVGRCPKMSNCESGHAGQET